MRHTRLTGSVTICAAVLSAAVMISVNRNRVHSASSIYDPYPPGILPTNVASELARVRREINEIEAEAIAQWHALPPPTVAGNPPVLQGTGVQAIQILGKLMNYDINMSVNKDTACASCHMPYVGFGGPIPSVNLTMIAYPGSVHYRAGKRTPQRYPYAPFFPVLNYNPTQ
jgi:cytochrome c peroxidase